MQMKNLTLSARFTAMLSLILVGAEGDAAPPQVYQQAAYESPTRGDPDDLLLLAGYGFAADDTVVYRAISKTTLDFENPTRVPAQSGALSGVAPVVSSADVPYSVTIKLPQSMRPGQSYALWVRTVHGEWSHAVKINDARPLWVTPAFAYVSTMPGLVPRELKVVGRNLQPSDGQTTQIRLIGPQQFTGKAVRDKGPSDALDHYLARVSLPERLTPGRYRVQVNRDGASWVELGDQLLEVLPDPQPAEKFSVGDPRFGGCLPDDGADDAACIKRAMAAAAHAGGGIVYFGPGTWDLIESSQPGQIADQGILVPAGVQLRGAGSALTRIHRHAEWSARAATAAFTLVGHTLVTGITFRDLQVYAPGDHAAPFLQLGEDWQRAVPAGSGPDGVSDVVISRNTFDRTFVAIGSGGLPIDRLFITYNIFGAYSSALELTGDQFDMMHKYRLDDSVIDFNVFEPGSKLDLIQKTGTIATELGAGHRVDFSVNTADGASTRYLYAPTDARGWRAAFFWNPNNNVEEVLVSQNIATCTADKIGDGEAISFDNNTNTFAFTSAATVTAASASAVEVSAPFAARQHDRDIPIATYYVGHWVQIVSGPGLGQVRKITGYATDSTSRRTVLRVAPDWDVIPSSGRSRVTIGRQYWQLYVVANRVDNREPLCQKSNRSRRVGGSLEMWGQAADSVFSGNRQFDSDGIFVQQAYGSAERTCSDCTMMGSVDFFSEIRDNVVDGEYDWMNDCSRSGIGAGVGVAPWETAPPPTVSFGVSISHNMIRHADAQYGGAVAQINTWADGPAPQRWPLSDNMLIHHNSLADIDGARAKPICGASRPRIGIAFPDPAIAWRTVLYANSCKNVSTPIGSGGIDTVKVCPSTAPDSCECPAGAR
jgi:hypothetical protein